MRETFYDSVDALQVDLDAWLVHYNTERPHLGYRNMGRRPAHRDRHVIRQPRRLSGHLKYSRGVIPSRLVGGQADEHSQAMDHACGGMVHSFSPTMPARTRNS